MSLSSWKKSMREEFDDVFVDVLVVQFLVFSYFLNVAIFLSLMQFLFNFNIYERIC